MSTAAQKRARSNYKMRHPDRVKLAQSVHYEKNASKILLAKRQKRDAKRNRINMHREMEFRRKAVWRPDNTNLADINTHVHWAGMLSGCLHDLWTLHQLYSRLYQRCVTRKIGSVFQRMNAIYIIIKGRSDSILCDAYSEHQVNGIWLTRVWYRGHFDESEYPRHLQTRAKAKELTREHAQALLDVYDQIRKQFTQYGEVVTGCADFLETQLLRYADSSRHSIERKTPIMKGIAKITKIVIKEITRHQNISKKGDSP